MTPGRPNDLDDTLHGARLSAAPRRSLRGLRRSLLPLYRVHQPSGARVRKTRLSERLRRPGREFITGPCGTSPANHLARSAFECGVKHRFRGTTAHGAAKRPPSQGDIVVPVNAWRGAEPGASSAREQARLPSPPTHQSPPKAAVPAALNSATRQVVCRLRTLVWTRDCGVTRLSSIP